MGLAAEVCVRIQGDGKRVEKRKQRSERESEVRDVGGLLLLAYRESVARSLARSFEPASSVWPQTPRDRSEAFELCARFHTAFTTLHAQSCSRQNGKFSLSSPPPPHLPLAPLFSLRLAIARPRGVRPSNPLISAFSKEHDHSSFYKFLQMEHNHKNLDCYFFYYSTCKKVRTPDTPRASPSPLLSFPSLPPCADFRLTVFRKRDPYHIAPGLAGPAEVRSAILMPC